MATDGLYLCPDCGNYYPGGHLCSEAKEPECKDTGIYHHLVDGQCEYCGEVKPGVSDRELTEAEYNYPETAEFIAAVAEDAKNARFEQHVRQSLLWHWREYGWRHTFWVCVYKYLTMKGV